MIIFYLVKKYRIMERAKEKQKLSWDGMIYSIRRMDLLIISISGAGVYICLEILIGIMINFISQILGYEANKNDFLMHEIKIDAGKDLKDKDKKDIEKYDNKSQKYSDLTDVFNYLSISFMFSGLILILVFFLAIF